MDRLLKCIKLREEENNEDCKEMYLYLFKLLDGVLFIVSTFPD